MKVLFLPVLTLSFCCFLVVNTSAQSADCVVENSSALEETSRSGTAPNQTCNYTFTPNVTTPSNGQQAKLLQYTFVIGGSTIYACYTSPTGTAVIVTTQTTPCGSVNDKLPGITSSNLPSATFSFPCSATDGTITWNAYTGASAGGGTGECAAGTSIPNAPLPVKLISFTSKTEANGNLLQWETTEEVNSEKFVVQRSQNAVNFNDIFTVETGSDSNEPKRYSYLDDSPVFGTNYYRLKQIDIDGSMSFSKIVASKWDFQSEIIFPNPVTDKRFVIDGVSGEIIRAILSDFNNRSIPVKLEKSGESVTATLAESMASGVYFLQIQTSTKSISKKIVVQ